MQILKLALSTKHLEKTSHIPSDPLLTANLKPGCLSNMPRSWILNIASSAHQLIFSLAEKERCIHMYYIVLN